MIINGEDRSSRLATCLAASNLFLLRIAEARALIKAQIGAITEGWEAICNEAKLSATDRVFFWGRQFLNPYAFQGLEGEDANLRKVAETRPNLLR